MIDSSRRSFLGAGALLPLASMGVQAASPASSTIEADLLRYAGFGNKRAGGPGDMACGAWLADELKRAGYAVERQEFAAPFFDATVAELTCGDRTAPVYPQPVVIPTGPGGVSGPLVRVDPHGRAAASLQGAIALVDLPHARWSSMLAKAARGPIEAAFAAGAKAAVAITNGPTGKLIALNADGRKPMFAGPVALIAPEDADPFLAAAMQAPLTAAVLLIEFTGSEPQVVLPVLLAVAGATIVRRAVTGRRPSPSRATESTGVDGG